DAAGSIGNTAVKAVKDMLVGVVEGVKQAGCALMPKARPEKGSPVAFSTGKSAGTSKVRHGK
ncbi:MAG TPA: hypothetical protein VEI28_04585, partial [Thermodesulfovibrionales bacterium]|nr:hypothetical protein [Thermodesulfovibrionales bacterium]